MRTYRKTKHNSLPRAFLPWDPLQLPPYKEAVKPVTDSSIIIEAYRTYKHKVMWSPLVYKNFGFFYQEDSQLEDFLINFLKQGTKKTSLNFELHYYTTNKNNTNIDFINLDDTYIPFFYHPYEESYGKLLYEILKYKVSITKILKKEKRLNAESKYMLIMTELDDEAYKLLSHDPNTIKMWGNLITKSINERIIFIPVSKNPQKIPKACIRLLDSAFFLGNEIDKYARDTIFSDFDIGNESYYQLLLGSFYGKNFDVLKPIHPIKYTESKWAKSKREAAEEEEKLYREFLNSLNDGEQQHEL